MPENLLPSPFWDAHDDPDRPLDSHVLICACVDCETAIRNEARRHPHRPIWVKSCFDRLGVTLEYFVDVIECGSIEDLLYVPEDYVREVYVADDGWLPYGSRWFSTACRDDEEAEGRRVLVHRVAKRRSARSRRRHEEETRAWKEAHPPGPPVVLPPLAAVIGPARREHHDVVLAATQWCLAEGRPIDGDLIALICAGATSHDGEIRAVWTRQRVNHTLRIDTWNWCTINGCRYPDGVAEALWQFLGFLAATDRLDHASQPLDRLRDALRCTGLDDDGRPRSADVPRFRCECDRPYRGPTHGEVTAGGE